MKSDTYTLPLSPTRFVEIDTVPKADRQEYILPLSSTRFVTIVPHSGPHLLQEMERTGVARFMHFFRMKLSASAKYAIDSLFRKNIVPLKP